MHAQSLVFQELKCHWKATCRLIFGEEIGELEQYSEWLSENTRPLVERRSSFSGKKVMFVYPFHSNKARFASLDEIDFNQKFQPLSINEIKDIDSIISALGERVCYTGNIVLGQSKFVEYSTDIIDSNYIADCAQVTGSKYIAHCYNFEYAESMFGCMNFGYASHCIRINECGRVMRCLESLNCESSSDLCYCQKLFNCKNCIFSFNLRNREHAIGNLILPLQKYQGLRAKLMAELAGMLRKDKKLPSILEIIRASKADYSQVSALFKKASHLPDVPKRSELVEKAFQDTSRVLFGRQLEGLEKFGKWLQRRTREMKMVKSAATGSHVVLADHSRHFEYPPGRIVSEPEAEIIGKHAKADERLLEDFSVNSAHKYIGAIAFITPEKNWGKLDNVIGGQVSIDAVNCFQSILTLQSKNCAYNYYSLDSDSVFGCNTVRNSSFIFKCYLSSRLKRCFEVDSSNDCSDGYFLHNCENVHESMFCFNVKNRRHAIGNADMPRDEYARIKEKVKAELFEKISSQGGLGLDIFTVSCKK